MHLKPETIDILSLHEVSHLKGAPPKKVLKLDGNMGSPNLKHAFNPIESMLDLNVISQFSKFSSATCWPILTVRGSPLEAAKLAPRPC